MWLTIFEQRITKGTHAFWLQNMYIITCLKIANTNLSKRKQNEKCITNPQRLGVSLIGRVCVPYVESRGFTRTPPKEKYKHTEIHSVLLQAHTHIDNELDSQIQNTQQQEP